jgi:pilus assembly protein CpaF
MRIEEVIKKKQTVVTDVETSFDTLNEKQQSIIEDLKRGVREKIIKLYSEDDSILKHTDTLRLTIRNLLEEECESVQHEILFTQAEKKILTEDILQQLTGFGIIDPLINDENVTEIMINGREHIFIEKSGRLQRVKNEEGQPLKFQNESEMINVIEKIVAPINRKVDESDPIVDARLPDGSRVNVVIRPVSLDGPIITIRKFPENPYTMEQLIQFGSIQDKVAEWLNALVTARYNIVISGGTGSGKTTFLNTLGMYIPGHERVVTVEDSAELKLTQIENLVRLETRPPNIEGKGEITMRDLVKTALRMRPDRIVVGEVRGGEALDMLQAMNTGHDGSLTTAHSNSSKDMLSRLETMVLMSGLDLPLPAIRRQIASAVEVIVHLGRLRDGSRKVLQISEVRNVRDGEIEVVDLLKWKRSHVDDDGRLVGQLEPTGELMQQDEKWEGMGYELEMLQPDKFLAGGKPCFSPIS